MSASVWTPGSVLSPVLPAAAPVQFVTGTAALPGVTLVGDTNTGIYSTGDGTLGISSNGVPELIVDSTGVSVPNGTLNLAPEITIASAATCDIGTIASNSMTVTGTATIGSLGTTYSGPKFLRFTGACVLNYSANLILPGGVSITTGIGDTAVFIPKATLGVPDGWVCVSYQYGNAASGRAVLDVYSTSEVYNKAETDTLFNTVPQAQGYRNPVLNGDFAVDQEFAGAAVTVTAGSALKYVIDGWYAWCTGANVTFQTITTVGRKRAHFTGTPANTLVGFATRMEAANTADFALKFATLRMLLSSSSITTVNWGLYYANTTNTFGTVAARTRTTIQTGTFTINSTEAAYSAITSAILNTAANTGLELEITVGALLGTQTLTIGDVQVEKGSIAAPIFEQVDITENTRRCYRIMQPCEAAAGAAANTTLAVIFIQHAGMFSAPSPSASAALVFTDNSTSFTQSSGVVTVANNTANGGRYLIANFTGLTAGTSGGFIATSGKIFLKAYIP